MKRKAAPTSQSYLLALTLVISLFFMWGLVNGMLHTLNAPFKAVLALNNFQSSLLQTSFYLAYFIFCIPAALLAAKKGYKTGLLLGLALCVLGGILVLPATSALSFILFLLAMFVLASGIAIIETNANPYITKLGDQKSAAFRLNLAQSFNGVGAVLGPILAGLALPAAGAMVIGTEVMAAIGKVYLGLSLVFLVLLLVLIFTQLPGGKTQELSARQEASANKISLLASFKELWAITSYRLGVMALLIFIGAQVSGFALFSTFAQKQMPGLSLNAAANYLAVLMGLFVLGRIVGTALMAKIVPAKLLGIFMSGAALCLLLSALGLGAISVYLAMAAFFFVSIGFPTIFSLALSELNEVQSKIGASLLMMSNVGSALMPLLLGLVADLTAMNWAFVILGILFGIVALYAFNAARLSTTQKS